MVALSLAGRPVGGSRPLYTGPRGKKMRPAAREDWEAEQGYRQRAVALETRPLPQNAAERPSCKRCNSRMTRVIREVRTWALACTWCGWESPDYLMPGAEPPAEFAIEAEEPEWKPAIPTELAALGQCRMQIDKTPYRVTPTLRRCRNTARQTRAVGGWDVNLCPRHADDLDSGALNTARIAWKVA